MLTLAMLKSMPAQTVFATGVVTNPRLNEKPVRWAARRGGIPDWTIYYHYETMPYNYVLSNGDKVISDDLIRELVPCDDAALGMYRK